MHYREIAIRKSVKLPALSTNIPEREYTFIAFLIEWVIGARGLRRDEYLPHLFEWEETVETFMRRMDEKAATGEPTAPLSAVAALRPDASQADREAAQKKDEEALKAYTKEVDDYQKKIADACAGESIYVTDDAYKAAKEACKQALDKASEPDAMGRRTLAPAYEPKILRHYHAFCQAPLLEENDVPKGRRANGLDAPQPST
jgi:hypothetical protein